jgi:putative ABC transport system ATP-binding protein
MNARLESIGKRYVRRHAVVDALAMVTHALNAGDFLVVHGPSGSGKSTLLLVAGGMLRPSSGRLLVDGRDIYALSASGVNAFRRCHVGFVFQRLHLLDYLSIRDNLHFALAMRGRNTDSSRLVETMAESLGIPDRLDHLPRELSIGEQQRAAVARALVGEPDIVLADEPTGNLDLDSAKVIASRLADYARSGHIVVMVTHNHELLKAGTQLIELRSGRVFSAG